MENDEMAITVRELRKSFGDQTVLNGVNLKVARGETVAILGRSGTGKSVLLKLLIGLQKPDAGSIQFGANEITALNMDQLNEIRKKVGFLFQQAALYDSLTVGENVAFPLAHHGNLPPEELKDRVRELLSQVGMERETGKLPSEISGGMQKRVGLARALALDPEILLCDEPTSGLDPITAGEIEDLILRLQEERKITSLVVTHDLRASRTISRHLAILHQGNILIEGTFEDLKKSQDSFVSRFMREEAQKPCHEHSA
jgi:phospholipid/cholesterol/gamma-HCH transport system ATP-binding protein